MPLVYIVPATAFPDGGKRTYPHIYGHIPIQTDFYRIYDAENPPPEAGFRATPFLTKHATVPLKYAVEVEQALRRKIDELQGCLTARDRKPADATRAKYERMKQARREKVKWTVIASREGYKSDRSAQNHFRTLRRQFEAGG
jgi:hypothetical protein